MDPNDNAFHSWFKRKYSRDLLNFQSCDIPTKLRLAEEVYYSVDEDTVRNYFVHCGLLGGEPSKVVSNLVMEGCHPSPRYKALHQRQLEEYRNWRSSTHFHDDVPNPVALEGCTLDGVAWTRWKSQLPFLGK